MDLSQDGRIEIEILCKYTQVSIAITLEFLSLFTQFGVRKAVLHAWIKQSLAGCNMSLKLLNPASTAVPSFLLQPWGQYLPNLLSIKFNNVVGADKTFAEACESQQADLTLSRKDHFSQPRQAYGAQTRLTPNCNRVAQL
jgi:hypothetical protein